MWPLTRKKLKPSQNGTKKLLDLYGDRLLCVRYKFDTMGPLRLKTMEIIVDSSPWIPADDNFPNSTLVELKIGAAEKLLQQKIKTAGGLWNGLKRRWEISLGKVKEIGLRDRIDSKTLPRRAGNKNA
jgi:hypothetical protein